jgi:hypothetical protein
VTCTARSGGKISQGKALLETDALVFRGDFRLRIPLKEIQTAEARQGQLRVVYPRGELVLDLGRRAEVWAQRIRSPKGRLDKLGVRPDSRVAVLGVPDEGFRAELSHRTRDLADRLPAEGCDIFFLGIEDKEALGQVTSVAGALPDQGALWVVYPKGRQSVTEGDVLTAGRAAGLTDTKVVRFSETHTALKFVVPRARRARR